MAAERTARSVRSPRGRAETSLRRRESTGAATPPAWARRMRAARRPEGSEAKAEDSGTRGLRFEPQADHREVPRQVHHVASQDIHAPCVVERGKPFGVGVDELLEDLAEGANV